MVVLLSVSRVPNFFGLFFFATPFSSPLPSFPRHGCVRPPYFFGFSSPSGGKSLITFNFFYTTISSFHKWMRCNLCFFFPTSHLLFLPFWIVFPRATIVSFFPSLSRRSPIFQRLHLACGQTLFPFLALTPDLPRSSFCDYEGMSSPSSLPTQHRISEACFSFTSFFIVFSPFSVKRSLP